MRVLVTGGAKGIGAGVSERLLKEGHTVLICYHASEQAAQRFLTAYENAYIFRADLSKREDIDALFDYIREHLGGIDAVVNNAGVSIKNCFQCVSDEDFDYLMAVNFGAVYKVSARATQMMLAQKSGAIVNISSIWGVRGAAAEALYSASKAAVIGLTEALAAELGPSGIRVNCVAPGVIDTWMNRNLSEQDLAAVCEQTPLGRVGKERDIAGLVSFLLSEDASFITGQTIVADGGFLNG